MIFLLLAGPTLMGSFWCCQLWKYYDIAPISILVLSDVQPGLNPAHLSPVYSPRPHLHGCLVFAFKYIKTKPAHHWLKGILVFSRLEMEYCFYPPRVPLYASRCTARSPEDEVGLQSPADCWCWPTSALSASLCQWCLRLEDSWSSNKNNKYSTWIVQSVSSIILV